METCEKCWHFIDTLISFHDQFLAAVMWWFVQLDFKALLLTFCKHIRFTISLPFHVIATYGSFTTRNVITGVFLTPDTDLNLVTNIWLLVVQTEYEGVVNLVSAAKNNGDVKKVCQQTFVNWKLYGSNTSITYVFVKWVLPKDLHYEAPPFLNLSLSHIWVFCFAVQFVFITTIGLGSFLQLIPFLFWWAFFSRNGATEVHNK